MSKAFASIKQGLQEAIAHRKGGQAGVKLHVPPQVNVKEVRRLTGLTQVEFAARFAISLGTPRGTALVLLNIIAKEPKTVLRALEAA